MLGISLYWLAVFVVMIFFYLFLFFVIPTLWEVVSRTVFQVVMLVLIFSVFNSVEKSKSYQDDLLTVLHLPLLLSPWIIRKINERCMLTKEEQKSGNVSSSYVASEDEKKPPFIVATVDPPSCDYDPFLRPQRRVTYNILPEDPPSVARKIKDRDRLVASEKKKLYEVVSMDPLEFELYCAQLLTEDGWDAQTTKASGDQGVDIIATRKGIKCVFQVKKHNKPVGNKAVQEVHAGRSFYGNVDFAFVVTNKGFTITAKALAKATEVHLIHYSELCDLSKYIRI